MGKKISELQYITDAELPSAFLVAATNGDNKKIKIEDHFPSLSSFSTLKNKVEVLESIMVNLDVDMGNMDNTIISTIDKIDNFMKNFEVTDANRVLISSYKNTVTTSDITVDDLNCLSDIKDNIQKQIDDLKVTASAIEVLPGTVSYFAGSKVPAGYLLCDGRTVDRITYPKLFEKIGTTWGAGDGLTTFGLPNLLNRVVWGSGTSGVGTYKEAGLPNITGTFDGLPSLAYSSTAGAFKKAAETGRANRGNDGTGRIPITFDASRSNSIYGRSTTVQPPAATLIPIIKY